MIAVGNLSWEHLYCHALTMFHLPVLYKGEFNTVFGSILYETDDCGLITRIRARATRASSLNTMTRKG